ncbi:MAG: carboxypeptidase-like regulatory domain-containing protein [Candidatus Krumholzibacteriia bacterium]
MRFEISKRALATLRPASHAVLAGCLLAGAAVWLGCEEKPGALLGPTGGAGDCFSDLSLIQVVGDFTDPAWTVNVSPVMTLGGDDCFWSTVVKFTTTGEHIFKFVVAGDFANPDTFGGDEGVVLDVGKEHSVLRGATGHGDAINLDIPKVGCYELRLWDEREKFMALEVPCSSGGIRGSVQFEGVDQPPLPRARVQALLGEVAAGTDSSSADDGTFEVGGLAAGTYEVALRAFGFLDSTVTGVEVGETVVDIGTFFLRQGCVSAFDSIQVVGEITDPPWDFGVSPHLQQVEGCKWETTVAVQAGTHLFKLVTDGAFDSPLDYGGDQTQVLEIDSTHVVEQVSGEGTALQMSFPFTGTYVFMLDEEASTLRVEPGDVAGDLAGVVVFAGETDQPLPVATVRVLDGGSGAEVASGTTSSADGSFLLRAIDQGLYDVRIEPPVPAPTHFDTVVTGVGVGGGTVNLGQIHLARATGGVQGQVDFLDLAGEPPGAAIELTLAGELAGTAQTSGASSSFAFGSLKSGSYELRVAADGFFEKTIMVAVERSPVDVGTLELERIVCDAFPDIESMKLGGTRRDGTSSDDTFTWNLGLMPVMSRLSECVWEVEVTSQFVAEYRIKFITNGDFVAGDPPAFGGDDVTVTPADSAGAIVRDDVPGTGNTLLIRIEDPGIYRFEIDLDSLTFSYTRVADLPEDGGMPLAGAGDRAPGTSRPRAYGFFR